MRPLGTDFVATWDRIVAPLGVSFAATWNRLSPWTDSCSCRHIGLISDSSAPRFACRRPLGTVIAAVWDGLYCQTQRLSLATGEQQSRGAATSLQHRIAIGEFIGEFKKRAMYQRQVRSLACANNATSNVCVPAIRERHEVFVARDKGCHLGQAHGKPYDTSRARRKVWVSSASNQDMNEHGYDTARERANVWVWRECPPKHRSWHALISAIGRASMELLLLRGYDVGHASCSSCRCRQ